MNTPGILLSVMKSTCHNKCNE